ncbi:ribonuclease H-like domain-containing protein [Tanacetum coccineum]
MKKVSCSSMDWGFSTRQKSGSRGAINLRTVIDDKGSHTRMAEYSQKWHNGTSRSRGTETSDELAAIQAQLNNLGREIKKVNEKGYAAQVGCEQCKGPYYAKDYPLKKEGRTLEEAFYMQFGGPFQGGGYRVQQAPGILTIRNNANPYAAIRNQGASIKTLEIQIGQMSKVCFINALVDVEQRIGKFVFPVDFIILDMPEDIKVPLILGRPFLSTARAKTGVYKRKITLRIGEERIVFKSVKPASSLTKRVYMLSLRERMELYLEARVMIALLAGFSNIHCENLVSLDILGNYHQGNERLLRLWLDKAVLSCLYHMSRRRLTWLKAGYLSNQFIFCRASASPVRSENEHLMEDTTYIIRLFFDNACSLRKIE